MIRQVRCGFRRPRQDDQAGWLPLGVFGMVQGQQTDPTMIFQLAVNQRGIVRGNFYSTITDTTLPVHGAVDKKTQRVAWTMGDNKSTVVDTGLANLTKDEGPALLHFGKDRTEEWLLVRLKGKAEKKKRFGRTAPIHMMVQQKEAMVYFSAFCLPTEPGATRASASVRMEYEVLRTGALSSN